MSKLEQLINELCPDGVNLYRIDEICNITRGRVMSKDYIRDNEGIYPVYSSQTENNGELGSISTYDFEGEYLTWTTDGANAGSVFYRYGKFSVTNVCGLLKVIEPNVNTKYLYHILSITAPKFVNKGMGNPKLMSNVMARIKVPVPPIEVQDEIVKILDNFTELTKELTTELSAELTARKQQYEYYRDYLLSFDDEDVEKVIPDIDCSNVKIVKLCEIAEIGTGSHNTNEGLTEGIYPFYVRSQEPLKMNTYEFDETAIITAGDGVGVGKVYHFVNGKYALHQRAYRIHPISDSVNPKYLFYWFQTKFLHYIQKSMYQSSVASIRRPMLNNFEVLIPSIETQNNIVQILDRFDMLCNGISEGIPAEIEARKQQYEYYRDILLSFNQEACSQIVKVERERELTRSKAIKWIKISDVFTKLKGTPITAGKMKEIANEQGNVRIFAGGKTVVNAFENDIPKANITNVPAVLVQSRGLIDFVYYDKPFTFKNEMWAYTNENQVTVKYLYYYLKNNIEHFRVAGSQMGSMPQISTRITEDFVIPIPTLEEQERIVSILDRFDKLCNDISEGIPAEIEARKQQYEYYRDKLLTFKEKVNE